jgi:hypothetical protein
MSGAIDLQSIAGAKTSLKREWNYSFVIVVPLM